MDMTKPYLDFGLQSDRGERMQTFWRDEIGLSLSEVVTVYEGVDQYRYALHGAVLKLNVMAQPMAPAPCTGYRRMIIATAQRDTPRELSDPDGNMFLLVPGRYLGSQQLGLDIAVSDLASFRRFYGELLQLPSAGDNSFNWGKTRIQFLECAAVATTADDHGTGLRYITFQVRNLDEVHARLISAGVVEHSAPTRWNEMSYVSFIRDPDNNLIELSQRMDLL